MTVEKRTTDQEQLRLAIEYLSAGLGELEQLITRRQLQQNSRSLALEDSAGSISLGLQELRRVEKAGGPVAD